MNIALARRRNRFETARLDFMEAQFVYILGSVEDQMAQVIRDKIFAVVQTVLIGFTPTGCGSKSRAIGPPDSYLFEGEQATDTGGPLIIRKYRRHQVRERRRPLDGASFLMHPDFIETSSTSNRDLLQNGHGTGAGSRMAYDLAQGTTHNHRSRHLEGPIGMALGHAACPGAGRRLARSAEQLPGRHRSHPVLRGSRRDGPFARIH